MSIVSVSIKRPIMVACIAIVCMAVGWKAFNSLGVDLFPDITVPIVSVRTTYYGAGPSEVETQVSKYIEDEVNTISGLKRLRSINYEAYSVVIVEFNQGTDIKYAEQQVRDKVSMIRYKLPDDIEEPIIERIDPNDQPVVVVALRANGLTESELYDVADLTVKSKLEQVDSVGNVEIIGGREREIHVIMDRDKLKDRELSAQMVYSRLSGTGENIPSGKINRGMNEMSFRSLGQFENLKDISNTVINLYNNDNPTRVKDIATVKDTLKDEENRAYVNGEQVLILEVYKQTGANTLAVVNGVKNNFDKINKELSYLPGSPSIEIVRDGGRTIQINVDDVIETIMLTILLTIIVIFLFLQSVSSTFIACTAIPVSLIGAFALMLVSNFTVNIITLLALSLAVSMVIDDAILIKENVFRHAEMGYKGKMAAYLGANQVLFAVLATSATLIAVYLPVAMMSGVIGQFLKQFGLVICFTTIISTLNALTMSPMLAAYLPDKILTEEEKKRSIKRKLFGWFDWTQNLMEKWYLKLLNLIMRFPFLTIIAGIALLYLSMKVAAYVPKTFLPVDDNGEFAVNYELPTGSSVEATSKIGKEIDKILRSNEKVRTVLVTVGGDNEVNKGEIYVQLIPFDDRPGYTTTMARDWARDALKNVKGAVIQITTYSSTGSSSRPFSVNLVGYDMEELKHYSNLLLERLKQDPRFVEPDTNYRDGKPELQITLDSREAELYGITSTSLGNELRAQVEGLTPAKYRIRGNEYDVRIRLKEEQRDLNKNFDKIYIPNINNRLIKLSDVADGKIASSASVIYRQDKARYIEVSSEIANNVGLGDLMSDVRKILAEEIKLPPSVRITFTGQGENFEEMGTSFSTAILFGVLFVYLILASLYESFITPFTILLSLPMAVCGALFALYITDQSLNLMSMLGIVMLISLATKSAIVLVDYASERMKEGKDIVTATKEACQTRFRPIMMSSITTIVGSLPIALGMSEAAQQRVSMGVVLVGGMITATILTLVIIPCVYIYIDKFRLFCLKLMTWVFRYKEDNQELED